MKKRFGRLYEDDYDDYAPMSARDGVKSYDYDDTDTELDTDGGYDVDLSFKTFGDLVEGDKLYVVTLDFDSHGLPVPQVKGITITSVSKDSIYCNRKYDAVFIEEDIDYNWDDSYTYVDDDTDVNDQFYAADRDAADYLSAKLLKIDLQNKVTKYKDLIDDLIND